MRNLFPAFKDTREGEGTLLVSGAGQVTLIQSNKYATEGYVGAACFGPPNYSRL